MYSRVYGCHMGRTKATKAVNRIVHPMPLPVYWRPCRPLPCHARQHPSPWRFFPQGHPFRPVARRLGGVPRTAKTHRWGRAHGALLPRTGAAKGIQMSTPGACVLRRLAYTWRAQAHARPRAQRGGGAGGAPSTRRGGAGQLLMPRASPRPVRWSGKHV